MERQNKVYVIAYGRSGIGKLNKEYKDVSLKDFSSITLNNILDKFKINRKNIKECILGCVMQHNLGQNISRQIALNVGLENTCLSYTINQVCGSSLKALEIGYNNILLGKSDLIVVGGVEKMTDSNFLVDGLQDAFSGESMAKINENLSVKHNHKREDLDLIAYLSHKKASNINHKDIVYGFDEHIRNDISYEKLSNLKPLFNTNLTTAGNSSGLNDGASFIVLANKSYIEQNNIEEFYEIVDIKNYANDPMLFTLAPIYSTKKILEDNKLNIKDIDVIEVNEAFSSQILSFLNYFNLEYKDINKWGGSIALGHPISSSGTRILSTLLMQMKENRLSTGLISICIGGGMAISLLIKKGENELI